MRLRGENTQLRRLFREALQRTTLLFDLLSAEQTLYHMYELYFRTLAPLTRQMQLHIHSETFA